MKYMSDAVNFLESDSCIARYAWFIPRTSGSVDSYPYMQLLTKTTPYKLSPLGLVYVNMSRQDKSVYYTQTQEIPAEHYSSLNTVNGVKSGSYTYSIKVRPTTDVNGILEIYELLPGYWLEYQIETSGKSSKMINFRYATTDNSIIEIYVDGKISATCNFEKTGAENIWNNKSTPVGRNNFV